MRRLWRCVLAGAAGVCVALAGCGGGGGSTGTTGGGGPTTPTVTVTPASNTITTAASLNVTVTVSGGAATPTGSVTLSGGGYTSSAATLASGSATITIPANVLAAGSDKLTASYTPDAASSSTYNSASGSATVTVNALVAPTVTVTPALSTIFVGQSLAVTVTVAGGAGASTPTGTVVLTGGAYTSAAATLSSGSATITIPATTLGAGTNTLTATYTPDAGSTGAYLSSSGTASVTVNPLLLPLVTVTPASKTITTGDSLSVTVTVAASGSGNPPVTGSVTLSSGSYKSAATTLSGGSATIVIPANKFSAGTVTLTANYTTDTNGAQFYTNATGTAQVTVNALATPTVTVTPASNSVNTAQSLQVTVTVAGGGGNPTPTGSVVLTSGSYTSSAETLTSGSVTITVPSGSLTAGTDTMTATYTPDASSSGTYGTATGKSSAVTVIQASTVAVDQTTNTGVTTTDQILGLNLATWYDVPTNASAINTAFAQVGIKAIRWPGGSWSDTYHWGDGGVTPFTCEQAKDGTWNNGGWGGWATFSQFETDIVQAGGYDLALTANYGSNEACTGGGDPTEAADWAAEAVKDGVPASHMTVGNEEYGSWEVDLHAKINDPTTYANAVIGTNGYYQLIKKASPTTLVGVVADAGGTQPGWDTTVLSTAAGSYDFIEYHYYPQYGNITSDTYLVHQAALDFTTNIKTLKSELSTAGETGKPIYVGEIGANSSNPGTQSWSITQALYAGQLLGEAMNDGVSRFTWWIGIGNCLGAGNNASTLYGWQNTWGSYDVISDADPNCPGAGPLGTLSPTARAFQLFSNVAVNGASVLNASVTGNTNDVRAYAATHSGGTALVLFNLNETTSQAVVLNLSAQSSSADVQVTTYDKSIYDQTNAATPVWAPATTTDMGAQSLPLTLTLTPWSMNVVIIK